jgi:hypothetical protein
MNCQNNQNQNQININGIQRYRLTYPEKNATWWSPIPDNCTQQRKKECCQRMLYTPTPANQCKSTFMPWDRPDPLQCLKLCKGINPIQISACSAEKSLFPKSINDNGCLMEPSVANYTNIPLNQICLKGSCQSQSILTDPNRNPPPPPQYGMKYSNAYDPILWTFGNPYTY